MRGLLLLIARIAGPLGALVCLVAGVTRLTGAFWLAGYTTATLLMVGAALMLLGCFCYLAILVENPWPHE